MDVLVDTNAIQATGLDGSPFKALRAYLARTRSLLLIPSVVVEELCGNRRRTLNKLQQNLRSAFRTMQSLVPGSTTSAPNLDIDAAVAAYRSQLLGSAPQVDILPNRPEDLPELVRRLSGRIPPASSDGEEARDVLIWLALLPIARSRRLAFVTGDRQAFLTGSGLRPELLAELEGAVEGLQTFASIDEFLRAHAARSSFIDHEWMKQQVGADSVERIVQGYVEDRYYLFESTIEELGDPTGYLAFIQIVQHEVEDFFVSDVSADELYVSATVWAELEVEVEYEGSRRHSDLDDERRGPRTKCICPCVRMELQLEVRGQDVTKATVGWMELA